MCCILLCVCVYIYIYIYVNLYTKYYRTSDNGVIHFTREMEEKRGCQREEVTFELCLEE